MEDKPLRERIKENPAIVVIAFCATTAISTWAVSRELFVRPRDEKIEVLKESLEECRQGHDMPGASSLDVTKIGSRTEGSVRITNSKFDFESGVMGWHAQESGDARGCSSVAAKTDQHYSGKQSLEMTLSISATDSARSKGEAWVTIANPDSAGKEVPVNLKGRTISAWIYAPQGSFGPGDTPNGLQLFVKDAHDRSLYGSWNHVTEETWIELLLKVSDVAEPTGEMTPGFDPTELKIFGIKFAIGRDSTASYEGAIYVDHVDW